MADLPLAVILNATIQPHSVGAPVYVSVEVRNISNRPLWMVGVLDGSEIGFRYPHYQPVIAGPEPLPAPELGDCGNVAPLRLSDFRHLVPNEGFDPTDARDGAGYLPLRTFTNFRPPVPGRYELRLIVSTESLQVEEWLGILEYPGKEAVLARLALVPRVRVESNLLVVEAS